MAFTDDDLKRLKVDVEKGGWSPKMLALIARLEAAEKVIKMMIKYTNTFDVYVPLAEDLEAWRKSAGRKE